MRDPLRRVVGMSVVAMWAVAGCGAAGTVSGDESRPAVRDAVIGAAPARFNAAAYAVVDQRGGDDVIVEVTSPRASRVTVMGASVEMTETADASGFPVALAAGTSVVFAPGGDHLMLEGLGSDLVPGEWVELRFVFERHGEVTVTAEVVPPADLIERVDLEGER